MPNPKQVLAQKKAQWQPPAGFPQLTPSTEPPTATIGAVDPNTRPANKGFTRFIVGPGGNWSDMSSPTWWARGMKDAAKATFFDPLNRAQKALNPFESGTPLERAAGIAEGALFAADMLTPGVPEGAMVNNLRRRAMERAVAREGSEPMMYGIHHSLTSGLKTIRPSQIGNQVTALDAIPGSAYFWSAPGRDMTAAAEQIPYQWNNALFRRADMLEMPPEFYNPNPSAYLVRAPASQVLPDANVAGSVARRVEGSLPVVRDITGLIDNPEAMRKAMRHYGLRSNAVPNPKYAAERAMADESVANMRRHAERGWR